MESYWDRMPDRTFMVCASVNQPPSQYSALSHCPTFNSIVSVGIVISTSPRQCEWVSVYDSVLWRNEARQTTLTTCTVCKEFWLFWFDQNFKVETRRLLERYLLWFRQDQQKSNVEKKCPKGRPDFVTTLAWSTCVQRAKEPRARVQECVQTSIRVRWRMMVTFLFKARQDEKKVEAKKKRINSVLDTMNCRQCKWVGKM